MSSNENWAKNSSWKKRQQAKKNVVKTEGKMIPHPTIKNTWIIVPVVALFCSCVGMKLPEDKYWHRQHQTAIRQQYQQRTKPGKGTMTNSFRPKGDIFRFIDRWYIIAGLALLTSCATLQNQKGYEHYQKNTSWENSNSGSNRCHTTEHTR